MNNHTSGNWRVDTPFMGNVTAEEIQRKYKHAIFAPLGFALAFCASEHDARLMAASPKLLDILAAYRKAYGKLHDILSDCIENGKLTAAELPDDYQAIADQLCGPCNEVEEQAKKLLSQLNIRDGGTTTPWNYHQHGEHAFFRMIEWCFDVTKADTILGYQEWVEHKIEELLHEIDLEDVDAIEVAGCIEIGGNVTVINEERAEFFSVYTRCTDVGVECICDFNIKAQAVEFAKALANRTKIPVCGNQCSLDL